MTDQLHSSISDSLPDSTSSSYMHGKAQRQPARHSVVLECKLMPLHSTCHSLPAVCYITYNIYAVRLAVSPNKKI